MHFKHIKSASDNNNWNKIDILTKAVIKYP